MNVKSRIAVAVGVALLTTNGLSARAGLSFYVEPNNPWPTGWYDGAVANMQTVVNEYNAYGDFGNGSIYVYYNSGIPTAQSGYGGYNGSIGDGGTYPNVRVLLHESSHWLGTGTYSNYWQGPAAGALEQQFDGVGALLNGDSQHYWPYGENYDNESSPVNDARHVAMVYALRKDFGIGSTASPYGAANVALAASDSPGTSGFDFPFGWTDGHFPQAGSAYSTGNFALRTPNGYAGWTFAGDSLTVNNRNDPTGGLVFNGYGTSGVVTIKNLVVDGGTVTHGQYPQDLFQLAGRVTLTTNGGTFNASQGNIQLLAPVSGTGSLTKAGPYTLTLNNSNTYSGQTVINAGTLKLGQVSASAVASYSFDNVNGATVVNDGVGGSAMNGTLVNGAAIVPGGKYGNAVSLSNGASVDINNPIGDFGNNGFWTVAAWVKTTTPGSTILSKSNGTSWSNGNTILYLGNGTPGGSGGIPSAVRYAGGFYQGSTAAASVTDGAWHQVAYVDNGGAYALYVDGAAQPLSGGNAGFGNGDIGSIVRLGLTTDSVAGDGTVNFNGLLDGVQFYAAPLSASQVSSLYQNTNSYGSLASTTNVTIAAGAKFDLNGAAQTIGSLTGAAGSAVTLGTGRLTVSSPATTLFAGAISGTGGSLVKQGLGVLTLGGANTYTGSTAINGGVLRLAPVSSSAVASYSFDNITGGTVVNDGTGGSAMNGTLAGGAAVVPGGRFGNAVSLANGASVNINNPITDLGNAASWTMSAWVKTTVAGSSILSKSDGTGWTTGNTIFYLGDGAAGGSGSIPSAVRYAGGFFQGSTAAAPVTDGTWHQVTYVSNGGAYAIYVDGVAQPLSPGNNGFANADVGSVVRLGATTDGIAGDGTVNFNGLLDSVQFYGQALTAGQVSGLFQGLNVGPLPTSTDVTIAAGATLDVNGTVQQIASLTGVAGAAVTLGAGTLVVGNATSTTYAGALSGAGTLVKQGTGTLTLASGVTTGYNAITVGAVTITGGTLSLGTTSPAANHTVLVTSGLTLNGGRLDVGTGDVILRGATLSSTTAAVLAGLNNPSVGIVTTAANSAHTTAVAVVTAGQVALSSFDGIAVNSTDVLVKYTYFGDANLDGRVDGSDYSRIDNGFLTPNATGWANGDFNYDGHVDASDYTLIDNAFNRQATQLTSASLLATPTAIVGTTAAVPEPAAVAIAVAAVVLGRGRCGLKR